VDRLEKILPFLDNAGYHHVYASGPGKKHGCLIAFDRNKYEKAGEKVVVYDTNDRGASFRTKNIGSIVALQDKTMASRGLVVATTHLFWHPSYNYERTR
jgi:RNA exonuclease NGL2